MKPKHWLEFLNGTITKGNISNVNSKTLFLYETLKLSMLSKNKQNTFLKINRTPFSFLTTLKNTMNEISQIKRK